MRRSFRAPCLVIAMVSAGLGCGGAREAPRAPTPPAAEAAPVIPVAAAPHSKPRYAASLRRTETAWVVRVVEACESGRGCPPVRRVPTYARIYECQAPRHCTATTALGRIGLTDDDGRVAVIPHDANRRPLETLQIYVVRDHEGPGALAAWLRDDHAIVDDQNGELVLAGEMRVEEAAWASSEVVAASALEGEESIWEEAVLRCKHAVNQSSCDGVREYQKRYPRGKHASEVWKIVWDATRALENQASEERQAKWKAQAETARLRQEGQSRVYQHEARERMEVSACLTACFREKNDRATCKVRCQ